MIFSKHRLIRILESDLLVIRIRKNAQRQMMTLERLLDSTLMMENLKKTWTLVFVVDFAQPIYTKLKLL